MIKKELKTRGHEVNLSLIYKIQIGQGIKSEFTNLGLTPPQIKPPNSKMLQKAENTSKPFDHLGKPKEH